ncbi:MAG: glutathione S-transferase N-terminal domain-containing protein [Candidatus Woesearchaeota archaeon]
MVKITLFQFEECPYCAKVRAKLAEKRLEYEKVNVNYSRDDPFRKELFEKSRVWTVPVLLVDDKYIGDSNKIIEYLDTIA